MDASLVWSIVEECIQVVVRRAHARCGQGCYGRIGQFAHMVGAPLGARLEELIFGVFMLGNEVAAGSAVTGDSHRFALRQFFVAAKVLGEFGCGNFYHMTLHKLVSVYYAYYRYCQWGSPIDFNLDKTHYRG